MSIQFILLSLLLVFQLSTPLPTTTITARSRRKTIATFVNHNGANNNNTRHKIQHLSASKFHSPLWKNSNTNIPQVVRGGGRSNDNSRLLATSPIDQNGNNLPEEANQTKSKKTPTILISTALVLSAIILNRHHLPSPSALRTSLVSLLDYLSSQGTPGLIIYALSLMLWEMTFGITTPVETAAGMAFGIKRGILASGCGKIGGAICSYLLGKYILSSRVHKALGNNEMLSLIEDDIKEHPLKVALIWRFSPLPEFVKNFGLSVLEPLKTRTFVMAVLLHGLPFTCLWTCMGNETGLLVRGLVDGPSKTLKVLTAGVTWFGVLVSPTLVGMWVKGLRDKQIEKNK
mmetsp:Transcript_19328/g.25530  ORF Transcript_19328/g.25530 Transcript_19328/m.25530 type:complete len:345 (+) Transcript_19328:109-1143(+)